MRPGRARRWFLVVAVVVLLAIVGLVTALLVTSGNSAASTTQYGVNVYVTDNCEPAAVWQANATNEMRGIKSLGANSVAIAFPFYTTGLEANSVFTANQCHGPTATPYAHRPVRHVWPFSSAPPRRKGFRSCSGPASTRAT